MDGETVISRVVRLIREFDKEADVIITSHDPRYEIEGARRYEPQNNVLEIGNQSFLAHRENTNRISETFIISLYLLFACSEDSIVPVTEKLHSEPKYQYG